MEVRFRCDSMDLAGEALQDLARFLKVCTKRFLCHLVIIAAGRAIMQIQGRPRSRKAVTFVATLAAAAARVAVAKDHAAAALSVRHEKRRLKAVRY